jgi:DNA helicase MCM8
LVCDATASREEIISISTLPELLSLSNAICSMAHGQPTGDEDETEFDLNAPTSGARVIISPSTGRERADRGCRDDVRGGPITSVPRSTWRGSDGWAAYFPGEYEADETCAGRSVIVQTLCNFFLTDAGRTYLSSVPERSFALPLDYESIRRPTAPSALQGIAAVIPAAPEEALPCIGLAASRAAEQICEQIADGEPLPVTQDHRLWPRIYNFGPLVPLRSLKGNSVGRFVAVRGTVVRVSNIRQQVTAMQFECAKCGECFSRTFLDYKFYPPTSCPTEKCRSRSFLPRRDTAETVDWQKIRVQEIIDQDDDSTVREEGRIPRTIDAELFADLIDSCIPGDTITVCGTVRVFSVDTAGGGGGGSGAGGSAKATKAGKCLYYLYIEANSTTSSRKSKTRSSENDGLTFDKGSGGTEATAIHSVIREVVREKDPFAFLVQSSVPSIYGHELVKAGMLLSLFGGSPKQRIGSDSGGSASGTVAIRRDVHCLVVGDPGLGKSQMLKAFTNIAPRGVYVCGNTTTTAGLTVTVVRESSGDFALEAGALVLGDMGVCCIDEFDKMGADHGALLEAMEQQSVSVAKAGMLCNLSARTTVIAAANPVGGHYDKSKTVCENLKIALPLLSRFDLVFILVDNPDEARDRFISEHVMKMFGMRSTERNGLPHGGPSSSLNRNNRTNRQRRYSDTDGYRHRESGSSASGPCQDSQEAKSVEPLASRLRSCMVKDPLPPSLFRQYIAYAKAYVHPELSEAAKSVLQDFYLTLRKGAHEQAADTTPITTRQLESLIRLSEARARSVMRTIVTESDARDVIEIMRESMLATLTDETGQVDLSRSTGMSRSKDARKFVAALHAESQRMRSAIFDKASLKRIAQSIGVDADGERFLTLIETINYQGYVTKKGHGKYELQSSSFSLTPTTRPLESQQGVGSQQRSGSDQQRGRRRPSAGASSDEYE